MNEKLDKLALNVGRSLLGIYFVLPGVAKFADWQRHVDLMVKHDIPLAEPLLFIAGVANIVLGGLLLANKQVWLAAYACVAYILVINVCLHDFWNYTGVEGAHELQNFVKNLGILAGCLMLASYARTSKH